MSARWRWHPTCSPSLLPAPVWFSRWHLVRNGLGSLLLGLGVAGLLAATVTGFLNLFNLLPVEFALHETGFAAQQHINAETILVALAAGVAGMLAVETRASVGVGVAISVTTIPAAAFLGVAVGIGELTKSLAALSVLAANIVMMLTGGSIALAVQRKLAADERERSPRERLQPVAGERRRNRQPGSGRTHA